MKTFFIGIAMFVKGVDEEDALNKVKETYEDLKADDRAAYAIAAPDGHEWAEESYGMFERHHEKREP